MASSCSCPVRASCSRTPHLGTRMMITNNNFFDNRRRADLDRPRTACSPPTRFARSPRATRYFRGNIFQRNDLNGLDGHCVDVKAAQQPAGRRHADSNVDVNSVWDDTDLPTSSARRSCLGTAVGSQDSAGPGQHPDRRTSRPTSRPVVLTDPEQPARHPPRRRPEDPAARRVGDRQALTAANSPAPQHRRLTQTRDFDDGRLRRGRLHRGRRQRRRPAADSTVDVGAY